jgi:hypothetical protein
MEMGLEIMMSALVEFTNQPEEKAVQEISLPTSLTSDQRKKIHELAEVLGLQHKSEGEGHHRHLKISRKPCKGTTCAFGKQFAIDFLWSQPRTSNQYSGRTKQTHLGQHSQYSYRTARNRVAMEAKHRRINLPCPAIPDIILQNMP